MAPGGCALYAPANSKTTEKLVAQALTLSNGGQATVLNLFSVKLKGVVREFEPLLDERGQLANPTTLLTQNLLGVSSAYNDLTTRNS